MNLSKQLADRLNAKTNDLVYITDTRRWLGGLRSVHAIVGSIDNTAAGENIMMGPQTYDATVGSRRRSKPVRVERLY